MHVLWLAAVAPPHWRVHWLTDGANLARSDWTSIPPQGPLLPFALTWLPDGFVLPAPVPRGIVTLGRTLSDGRETFDNLDRLQPGETFADSCLPLESGASTRLRNRRLRRSACGFGTGMRSRRCAPYCAGQPRKCIGIDTLIDITQATRLNTL